ncbi:acyl-CoA synthetase [Rhodococcus pyridinivorans]|uniref:acyl-CoA synthetase n=1 Tax=Rhodococcus pyridinivorans TaxID=103816 RepID=UPI003694A0B9
MTVSTENTVRWPDAFDQPGDLAGVEAVPLADRGLPATTYEAVARAGSLWPGRTAVTVLPDAERWQSPTRRTYRDLLLDVHRYANTLHGLGVRRSDVVAIMSPNCDELITATLAAELAGIAMPVNGALAGNHIRHLLERSGARVLVAADSALDPVGWEQVRALAHTGVLDTVLLVAATGETTDAATELEGAAVLSFAALAAEADGDRFVGNLPAADDVAALFHTGGTTGAPKLAAHTHRNEIVDAWSVAAASELGEDTTIFAALPLFHVNALVVTLLAPTLRGQHAVWAGPLGYRDLPLYGCFWKIVAHYEITTMSAVPTVYAVLATVPIDADISSLRMAVVGASMLPPAVRRAFEEHTGIRLLEGYGLTEATCASARSFLNHPRPGSVGQRLPYQRIKAVRIDENGTWTDLPAGDAGVLAISGPAVFPGYVVGRDADGGLVLDGLGKLVDGWLDTGDLGAVDADGFVHLTGRAKDLIIRGGHNIDPAQVEDSLLSHPAVTGAAAVGMPDVHAGEVPVAYVTLSAPTPEADLVVWAKEHVAEPAAAPKSVQVVDMLPVTAVGKPYKLPLRADAARRAATAALAERDGVTGVVAVTAEAEDGGVTVVVVAEAGTDETALAQVLDAFALTWRVATR